MIHFRVQESENYWRNSSRIFSEETGQLPGRFNRIINQLQLLLHHFTWEERLTRELLDDEDITWVGLVFTTTVPGDPATDVTTTPPPPPGTGTTLLLILLSMAAVLLLAPVFLCWKFSIIAATSPERPLATPFITAPSGVADSSELIPLIVWFSTGNSDI